jgi:hypothetical protein
MEANQLKPVVLIEEVLRYLTKEETVCSLAIERIEVDLKELKEEKAEREFLNFLNLKEKSNGDQRLCYR